MFSHCRVALIAAAWLAELKAAYNADYNALTAPMKKASSGGPAEKTALAAGRIGSSKPVGWRSRTTG